MRFSVRDRGRTRVLLLSKAKGGPGGVGAEAGVEEGRQWEEWIHGK